MRSFSADLAHPTGFRLARGSTLKIFHFHSFSPFFTISLVRQLYPQFLVPILAIDSLAGVRGYFNQYTLEKAQLVRE